MKVLDAPHCSRLICLQGNQGVTDEGMAHVGRMWELKSLELQFCWQLTDAGLSAACTCIVVSQMTISDMRKPDDCVYSNSRWQALS